MPKYYPNTTTANYPFGMLMPGRTYSSEAYSWGFNGKEEDDAISGSGNNLDFGARIYDSRLGRFLSVDPLISNFAFQSPYIFTGNQPIWSIDRNGEVKVIVITNLTNPDGTIQTFKSEIEITTLEDIKGITRTPILIHRTAKETEIAVDKHLKRYQICVSSYSVDSESGLTFGEEWKKNDPFSFYLSKAMKYNILGTGHMTAAMEDRDLYTGEYKSDLTRSTEFLVGVATLITLGRVNGTNKEVLRKVASAFLVQATDFHTMKNELFKSFNLNNNQKDVLDSYLNKFSREGDSEGIKKLQIICSEGALNKKYDLKGNLKEQLGIDLDMPLDKNGAVDNVVNYDGAVKKLK